MRTINIQLVVEDDLNMTDQEVFDYLFADGLVGKKLGGGASVQVLYEYELAFCENCIQMTNHLNDVCQKCLVL